jgi:hypothetical protein
MFRALEGQVRFMISHVSGINLSLDATGQCLPIS